MFVAILHDGNDEGEVAPFGPFDSRKQAREFAFKYFNRLAAKRGPDLEVIGTVHRSYVALHRSTTTDDGEMEQFFHIQKLRGR